MKVSSATVRTWIKNQELLAVKFDREYRIAKVDLQCFVDSQVTAEVGGPETLNKK